MSKIQLYILAFDRDKAEAQRIVAESVRELEAKETKLIDLITSLEPYINHKDDGSLRAKSVAYLAEVLHSLPSKVLSGQERHLLCDFILGRLEGDVEGVGSSAKALMALENLGKWDKGTAQRVMQTFINHTQPLRQFKLQTERYSIVQLLDLLLAKYREALEQLHDTDHEFMAAFISYFDGEKDPRNLMIIFSLLRVPMTEWNIHDHAQDLFDSVFNYFPITFQPPPDDPYGITAQDLKDRLRDCISANSDFAPFAFPQLLDKLDSTSMNTKASLSTSSASTLANRRREMLFEQFKLVSLATELRPSIYIPSLSGMLSNSRSSMSRKKTSPKSHLQRCLLSRRILKSLTKLSMSFFAPSSKSAVSISRMLQQSNRKLLGESCTRSLAPPQTPPKKLPKAFCQPCSFCTWPQIRWRSGAASLKFSIKSYRHTWATQNRHWSLILEFYKSTLSMRCK